MCYSSFTTLLTLVSRCCYAKTAIRERLRGFKQKRHVVEEVTLIEVVNNVHVIHVGQIHSRKRGICKLNLKL